MPVPVRRLQAAALYLATAALSTFLVLRSESLAAADDSWPEDYASNGESVQVAPTAPARAEPAADPRKVRLAEALRSIDNAEKALASMADYTCHMVMKERLGGKMGPANKVELSVRHEPFAVHMKWHEPRSMAGQEAVFNKASAPTKMRVKGAGLLGSVGFITLGVDDSRAKSTSRHTINEAGLANTIARVKASWTKLPMEEIEEIRILDGELAGRNCRQIILVNTEAARGKLEFHRTTLWFDLETGLLAGLDGHGWPSAGEKEGELLESYHYHDFRPNPALPNHHFTR